MLMRARDLLRARDEFLEVLRLDWHLKVAHREFAELLLMLEDEGSACRHAFLGLAAVPSLTVPYTGTGRPIRVLEIGSAIAGGHTNTDHILESQWCEKTTMLVEYWDQLSDLPAHDVAFNLVGDADLNCPGLELVDALLARSNAPIINAPVKVLRTGRLQNALRLANIPGLVVPRTATFARADLSGDDAPALLAECGLEFPLLLRSPGYNNGENFLLVLSPRRLREAVALLPGDPLLVIEFVDTRSLDGLMRKYRVMVVDGKLYPAHLAIGRQWKMHYFSAQMGPEERREEAGFLACMHDSLGNRAIDALVAIAGVLDLDYAGIDFALNAAGQIVFFEANATVSILRPAVDGATAYRVEAVERILSAARSMIFHKVAIA
ncbi:MAG: hypothetical protein JOZ38_06875 [Candidatus Eremiobacteraeota bacterium]|nr:hypothetical protein [Candidatus Eremiobacteraeota bacterium]